MEAGSKPSRRRGQRSWSALKSGYHALSGLLWVAPRTPSLKLGIAVMAALVGVGLLLKLSALELVMVVMSGVVLLAIETLNTALEMLCDALHPTPSPQIGKVKDVAAGATVITELGVAVVMVTLLASHLGRLLH